MENYSWQALGLYLLVSAASFLIATTVRPGKKETRGPLYPILSYIRWGGYVSGISFLLASIHVLVILLNT